MITLTVTPDAGEPFEVTAGSRDVLMWEKTTKGSRSFVDLMDDPTLQDLYRVAHIAAYRQQLFTGTLADFEQQCDVKAAVEEDPDPDPTQPAPSTDSSSDSPSAPASPRRNGRKKATAR